MASPTGSLFPHRQKAKSGKRDAKIYELRLKREKRKDGSFGSRNSRKMSRFALPVLSIQVKAAKEGNSPLFSEIDQSLSLP